jgi:glyoxylate reductase
MAHRAVGFGMKIVYYDPHPTPAESGVEASSVDLDTLLRESDFISLHTPLTKETRGLLNATAFTKMKPTVVVVNTSRGAVIDQSALYNALFSKRIFAAALDVTDPEPISMTDPILQLENCIIVPHIQAPVGKRVRICHAWQLKT